LKQQDFQRLLICIGKNRLNDSNPDENVEMLIKEIFDENNGNYGYRRIDMELRKRGCIVNHKKILRIMNKLNNACKQFTRKSRKYSSYKGQIGKVANNRIDRRFDTHIPYQKITTDTTEFKYYTKDKNDKPMTQKAYLDSYLDMFNGKILSYRLSERPNAKAILDALDETITIAKSCPYRTTVHTDQGWGIK